MSDARIVLDTNVFVNALLKPDTLPDKVLRYCLEETTILLTKDIVKELLQTFSKEKILKYIDREQSDLFVYELFNVAEHIKITNKITVCRDPRDDHILEAAINGRANAIVSGDNDLLTIKNFQRIVIYTPKEFLESI